MIDIPNHNIRYDNPELHESIDDIDQFFRINSKRLELLKNFDESLVRGNDQLEDFLEDFKDVRSNHESKAKIDENLGGDSRWISATTESIKESKRKQ